MKILKLEGAPKSEAKLRVRMALRELVADKREQRRERRIPYLDSATVCSAAAPAEKFSAFVRDISPGGIGLVHLAPMQFDEVVVTLHLPRGRQVAMVTQIVWRREFADGWFASGGKFLDALEAQFD